MASTSIKSAIARIGSLNYAHLEELRALSIPKEEQEEVRNELRKKEKNHSSLPEDVDSRLGLFESGSPLKCVRIPKREQRHAQIVIDEIKTQQS